ncbi:MAG: hypothetical protein IJ264_01505 [Clostridia bacterium]|nr:hypothetical protein [Clostridia bacterium]
MKCLNCGARVRKTEEICPECGKYISSEKEYIAHEIQTEKAETNFEKSEKSENAVNNIDGSISEKYDFKDHIILPSLLSIGGGLILLFIVIFSFIRNPLKSNASNIFCFFIAIFAIFNGIVSFVQEKECELNITSDRVYGRIPVGFVNTETIDIKIEDIISVNETGFFSKYPGAEVQIVTKENEYTIKGSSKTMLLNFSKSLKNKIKNIKEK